MKLNQLFSQRALIVSCLGIFLLSGCDNQKAQQAAQQMPAVSVTVFKVDPLNYAFDVVLPARVIASQIAEIRPQVSGIILKREFEESSNVTAGQSLYQIDPALYQASYDSAVASSASAKASADNAHLTLKRYEKLLKTKAISQQDYDTAAVSAQQADADLLVAQASENTAKVNLDYTKVYSPIDGYIGKSSVTEGALVAAAQTTSLATVQKLDPIYVDMTIAATRYNTYLQNQKNIYEPETKDNIMISFSDGTQYPLPGTIKFSDMSVNETTGTVTLRAEFPNPESKILPGMFVKSQIRLGQIKNAVVVPQQGITSNAKGQYTTYIVKPDNSIEYRTGIQVYAGIPGYWIVTKGINIGEKVVIAGQLKLKSVEFGAKIAASILGQPAELKQEQLDAITSSSLK